jgi:hypothetical protein
MNLIQFLGCYIQYQVVLQDWWEFEQWFLCGKTDYIKMDSFQIETTFIHIRTQVTQTLASKKTYVAKVQYISYESYLYNDSIGVKLRAHKH